VPLTVTQVAALVEVELTRIQNAQTAKHIRGLLVPPRCEYRDWDYGAPDAKHPCWIVAEHTPSNTGFAYCEEGFGPSFPWGLIGLSGERLSMGMDCAWHETLEEAVLDSAAGIKAG
jgi:hypothetical protein